MKVICWLIMERSIRFVPVMELSWAKNFGCPIAVKLLFSLIFPLLPPTVKVIDFIESDCEDCFKVWGIHLDGKLPELIYRMM